MVRSMQVTLDSLRTLPTPIAKGRIHRPIRFDYLVETLQDVFRPSAVNMAINPQGTKILGTLEFQNEGSDGWYRTVGFRTSTNSNWALKLVAGGRVIACFNGMLSSDAVLLKHNNDIRLDLANALIATLPGLECKAQQFQYKIDTLKDESLTEEEGCYTICEGVRRGIVPANEAKKVMDIWHDPYDYPENNGRTSWTLYNAFTRVNRDTAPMAQFGRTVGIGTLFGL